MIHLWLCVDISATDCNEYKNMMIYTVGRKNSNVRISAPLRRRLREALQYGICHMFTSVETALLLSDLIVLSYTAKQQKLKM